MRIGLMFKFDEMRAENMATVLKELTERYGELFKPIFKSITFDNGSEFAYNERMSEYVDVYYARAYRSCDRASNENYNGIVRRFIPKGSDFTALSQDDIDRINHYINTMPRKILGYKTALEVFRLETEKLSPSAA
jgi:IS30 family transposase